MSLLSHALDAHAASTDSSPQRARLECLWPWDGELGVLFDGGQPEAVLVGEVVARAIRAVTFYEWGGAEIFQTTSGAGQRLTTPSWSCSGVLVEKGNTVVRED